MMLYDLPAKSEFTRSNSRRVISLIVSVLQELFRTSTKAYSIERFELVSAKSTHRDLMRTTLFFLFVINGPKPSRQSERFGIGAYSKSKIVRSAHWRVNCAMLNRKNFLSIDAYACKRAPANLQLALADALIFNRIHRNTDLVRLPELTKGAVSLVVSLPPTGFDMDRIPSAQEAKRLPRTRSKV